MLPKVTIVCTTYNQVRYIKEALDSFIMQKTTFPFLIYIGDDCSTDGTKEIIEQYAEKYPEIVKPLFQPINTGGYENLVANFDRVETQYLAWCEGDDYWTDPYKLQKQVDFMDKHLEYTASFHYVKVKFEQHERKDFIYPSKEKMKNKNKITLNNLLKRNYIQTNSIMYRWMYKQGEFRNLFPNNMLPGDWYIHLLHAKKGDIGFIPEEMSVYRRQPNGVWYDTINNYEGHLLKNGVYINNFYRNVYENITDRDENYLKNNYIPVLNEILYTYFKNNKIEKIVQLKKECPEYVEYALKYNTILDVVTKKYKKYKKLFNSLLIFIIVENAIFLAFVLFYLFKQWLGG